MLTALAATAILTAVALFCELALRSSAIEHHSRPGALGSFCQFNVRGGASPLGSFLSN